LDTFILSIHQLGVDILTFNLRYTDRKRHALLPAFFLLKLRLILPLFEQDLFELTLLLILPQFSFHSASSLQQLPILLPFYKQLWPLHYFLLSLSLHNRLLFWLEL
jgi:hypothetical protein